MHGRQNIKYCTRVFKLIVAQLAAKFLAFLELEVSFAFSQKLDTRGKLLIYLKSAHIRTLFNIILISTIGYLVPFSSDFVD
jgi:hypothetical protein